MKAPKTKIVKIRADRATCPVCGCRANLYFGDGCKHVISVREKTVLFQAP